MLLILRKHFLRVKLKGYALASDHDCPKCGGSDFRTQAFGKHLALYCGNNPCSHMVRWVSDPICDAVVDAFKMPFGKHKGKRLASLDSGYLSWVAENMTSPISEYATFIMERK